MNVGEGAQAGTAGSWHREDKAHPSTGFAVSGNTTSSPGGGENEGGLSVANGELFIMNGESFHFQLFPFNISLEIFTLLPNLSLT